MPGEGHPNLIVFLTDQQRWDTTGLAGNPMGLTPNFDRLARRGTHLPHAFTAQPVCGPSRSCLQTGLYPTVTGCFRNGLSLPGDATTLAHRLGDAGYDTGYIGKWHLAGSEPVVEAERGGYRHWLAANALEHTSDAYRCELYDADGQCVLLPGYRVDALADAAIRFIAEPRERPFFLFLSFLEPHQQNHRDDYPAPEGYAQRYLSPWTPPDLAALGGSSRRHLPGYYGMVRRLDEALGRLQDALRSLGQEDRTVVLYTSDHGNHFRTRNQEYKRSCHEASIHVPAALWGPGFWGGGEIDRLVSLIDLPPTLLEAGGVEASPEMQGSSIRPLLQGNGDGWQDDVYVQISESEVGRAVRTRRWKYGVTAPGADRHRDAAASRYVEAHLYDLLADPYELDNLTGLESHAGVAGVLRERLRRRMLAAGEEAAEIESAPGRAAGQRRVQREEWSD